MAGTASVGTFNIMEDKKIFNLKIVTPTNNKNVIVEWLDAKTNQGNFFVGPKHSDLIAVLKDRSQVSYKIKGKTEPNFLDIYNGFIKISAGNALIITDH